MQAPSAQTRNDGSHHSFEFNYKQALTLSRLDHHGAISPEWIRRHRLAPTSLAKNGSGIRQVKKVRKMTTKPYTRRDALILTGKAVATGALTSAFPLRADEKSSAAFGAIVGDPAATKVGVKILR